MLRNTKGGWRAGGQQQQHITKPSICSRPPPKRNTHAHIYTQGHARMGGRERGRRRHTKQQKTTTQGSRGGDMVSSEKGRSNPGYGPRWDPLLSADKSTGLVGRSVIFPSELRAAADVRVLVSPKQSSTGLECPRCQTKHPAKHVLCSVLGAFLP